MTASATPSRAEHTGEASRRTSLHPVHEALGASFTDFGGWQMPLRYTSDLAEHHAVRTSAGIFDLSHMGEVWVRGEAAGAALDHALVGRLSNLAVGRARYTMLVTQAGGIVDDLIVYHVASEDYLVVPNAGNAARIARELEERARGFSATVEDASDATALIAVQGPRAVEVLAGVIESGVRADAALRPAPGAAPASASVPERSSGASGDEPCADEADVLCGPTILARLRYYAAVRATAGGHSVLLARTGYTGEDGFELLCCAEAAPDLWDCITAAAARLDAGPIGGGEQDGKDNETAADGLTAPADQATPAGQTVPAEPTAAGQSSGPVLTPCGLAARDSLRLEAGMALYGHELTENITPFDAGLGGVVALDKGEFVGREALVDRAHRQGQAGTSVLVALVGQGRRAARAGCPVLGPDGSVIGEVTSGLLSPTLGHPVALAHVAPYPGGPAAGSDRGLAWPVGTELGVDVRGRTMAMTVVAPPFYKRAR